MNRPRTPHVASDPVAGRTIGSYRLQRVLGEGGMGVVYMAEDQSLGRTVALKCIRPGLASNRSFLRRFRTEARALARINSPAIVTIHSLSEVNGQLLIDMEYVDGPTLKERIRTDGALAPDAAVPIMRRILRAFDDAHRAGVIHRDVKPQNIMLPRNGGVKITDFGLARVHTDADETVTRGLAGTPRYMSPEQVQNRADLDARSDLFSLGITFYEMLTGRLPYEDGLKDYQLMQTIVETDPPSMRTWRPELPQALDQVVMRALRRNPDRRYQSAAEMLRDLNAFATAIGAPPSTDASTDGDDAASGPGSGGENGAGADDGTPPRRRWVGWSASAFAAVALLVAVWWMLDAPEPTPPSTPTATLTVRPTPSDAQVLLDGRPIGVASGFALPDGEHRIRVQRAGFVPFDTTLTARAPDSIAFAVRLVEAQATLAVDSEPRGASIFVDDVYVGTTPQADLPVAPGTARVRLALDGHAAAMRTVTARAGESATLGTIRLPRLAPPDAVASADEPSTADPLTGDAPTREPDAPLATLTLRAVAGGSASVDGRAVPASGVVQVPPGERRVRFTHPEHGAFETTVPVTAGSERTLTAHFEHPLTVMTSGPWGNVWINGQNQSHTPFTTRLGPGTHRVELRIDRSDRFIIEGGTHTQQAGGASATSTDFTGAAVTIVVEPALQEAPHTLAYVVRN